MSSNVQGRPSAHSGPKLSGVNGAEFVVRLAAARLNQTTFAKRSGMSWRQTHEYTLADDVPARVMRLLQFEEMVHQLTVLADMSSGNRVTKAAIRRLLRGIEPPPKKRRRSGRKAGISPQKLNKPKRDPASFWKSLGQSRARADVPRSAVEREISSRPVAVRREVMAAYNAVLPPPAKAPVPRPKGPWEAAEAQRVLRANGVDRGWCSGSIGREDWELFLKLKAAAGQK
jgi:hypothetical protein